MRKILLVVLLMFGTANADMKVELWESEGYQSLGSYVGSVCIEGYAFAVVNNRFGMQMVQIKQRPDAWMKCDE